MNRTRLSDALWFIALVLLFVTLLAWAVAANYVPLPAPDATVVVEVGR